MGMQEMTHVCKVATANRPQQDCIIVSNLITQSQHLRLPPGTASDHRDGKIGFTDACFHVARQ